MADSATKLVDLGVNETSGVDHPAHLVEGWVVMKSKDLDAKNPLGSIIEKVRAARTGSDSTEGHMADAATGAGTATIEAPTLESLQADIQKMRDDHATEVESLRKELAEAVKPVEKSAEQIEAERVAAEKAAGTGEAGAAAAAGTAEGAGVTDGGEDAVLKALPDSVREYLEKQRADDRAALAKALGEVGEVKETLAKERDERDHAAAVTKAKDWAGLGQSAEELAETLLTLKAADPTGAKAEAYVKQMDALTEQAKASGLFKAVGADGAPEGAEQGGWDQIETLAKARVDGGLSPTLAKAIEAVSLERPDLVAAYSNEKKGR